MRKHSIALLFLFVLGSQPLIAAEYQFQALIDLDGDLSNGCAVESGETNLHGSELRAFARTDRAQVLEVVLQRCHAASWHDEFRFTEVLPMGLGQGEDGSDRIRWSVPLSHFAEQSHLSLRMLSARLDQPAYDIADDATDPVVLSLALGDIGHPLPTLDAIGLIFVALALLWLGWRHLRHVSQQAPLLVALMLMSGVVPLAHPISLAIADMAHTVMASDGGNDSKDAGSDILHTRIAVVGEALEVQFDVNNIEDNGLADNARILFIGNSLTYSNHLPLMVQAIAAQAGKLLVADAITIGGGSLQDHFQQQTAHSALANGGYQWAIMQQGPSSLPTSQNHLRTWASHYDPLIRAGGARPALYMVWPEASRIAYFPVVFDAYSNAALAINGMFVPAGHAWREAWNENPGLQLYGADHFHPSPLGSYAAALSIFAELYQQSPTGLPAQLTLSNGVVHNFNPEFARAVQSAAWRTHHTVGRQGG